MFKFRRNKKGVMLFIVLGMLLIVAIMIGGILGFISSSLRKTYHQVRRIKAYYAAMAGLNLAMHKLRTGAWTAGSSYKICHRLSYLPPYNLDGECCDDYGDRPGYEACKGSRNLTDSDISPSFNKTGAASYLTPYFVSISISLPNATTNISTINATVNYTTPN